MLVTTHWTTERQAEMHLLMKQGRTIQEVADAMGISAVAVEKARDRLKKSGKLITPIRIGRARAALPEKHDGEWSRTWNEGRMKMLRKLWADPEESTKTMADKLGVTQRDLFNRVQRLRARSAPVPPRGRDAPRDEFANARAGSQPDGRKGILVRVPPDRYAKFRIKTLHLTMSTGKLVTMQGVIDDLVAKWIEEA